MPPRTPPSNSGSFGRPFIVFEKSTGAVASTFNARIIRRQALRVHRRSGEVVNGVRYGRLLYSVYEPETFVEQSKRWIGDRDIVYGPDGYPLRRSLKRPIKHPYLFDCDQPLGPYD